MIGRRLDLEPALDAEKLHSEISAYLEFYETVDRPEMKKAPAKPVSVLELLLGATAEEMQDFFSDGWKFPDSPTWLF